MFNDFIGLSVFFVSHIKSYPPYPIDAISLLFLLNFAQYTLSLCPSNFWPADDFPESHISTDLSGLAETR